MNEDATPEDANTYEDPAVAEKWRRIKKGLIASQRASQRTLRDSDIGVIRIEIRGVNSQLVETDDGFFSREVWWDHDPADRATDYDDGDPLHGGHPTPVPLKPWPF